MEIQEMKKGTLVFVDDEGGIGEVVGIAERNGKKEIELLAYTRKGDKKKLINLEESRRITEAREGVNGSSVSARYYDKNFDNYGGVGTILLVYREERMALVQFPGGVFKVKLENLYEYVPY